MPISPNIAAKLQTMLLRNGKRGKTPRWRATCILRVAITQAITKTRLAADIAKSDQRQPPSHRDRGTASTAAAVAPNWMPVE